jgi:hypothetical protein
MLKLQNDNNRNKKKAIPVDVLDNKTEYNEAIEQLENFAIY